MRDGAERKADSEAVEVGARRCRDAAGVTVGEALAEATGRLAASGIDTARLDAELLAGKALGRSRTELYLDPERELAGGEEEAYRALVDRRALREPAAYILGEWGFRRLTLAVDPRVLIPRPGTESVVERCLELLRGLDTPEVLDAGTGSGAIALAIADEHPGARVTAIDASDDALAVARANADRAGLDVRLLLHDFGGDLGGPFDLVVSNPPYVFEHELPDAPAGAPRSSRSLRSSTADRRRRWRAQLATRSGPAARSCSRSATSGGRRSPACSESSATRTSPSRRI